MAPELIKPAVGVREIAGATFFTVAPWNIATIATQPYVVVAEVLVASEHVRNTFLPLIRGQTTQLVEPWYVVS